MPCSFCRSSNHNITNCNDPLIETYYEHIRQLYINIMSTPNLMRHNENIFTSVLNMHFYLKDLRAIGVKYLNVYSRTTKSDLILLILYYFHSLNYYHSQQTTQENTNTNLENDDNSAQDVFQNDPEDASILHFINMTTNPHYQIHNIVPHNLAPDFEAEHNNSYLSTQIKKYRIRLIVEENIEGFHADNEDEDFKDFKDLEDCAICYESMSDMNIVKLNCNHNFCGCCIKNTLHHNDKPYINPSCALCRNQISRFIVKNIETYNLIADHCIFK